MIICYNISDISYMTDVIVTFHFGLFFSLLPLTPSPSNSVKNQNFKKNEEKKKAHGDIIILQMCTKNYD